MPIYIILFNKDIKFIYIKLFYISIIIKYTYIYTYGLQKKIFKI